MKKANTSMTAPPKKITVVKRPTWTPTDDPPAGSIISFDVGIINLAYCILDYTGGAYRISDWNIINLADGNPQLTCAAMPGKTIPAGRCGKKAFYVEPGTGAGCCGVHGKGRGYARNLTVDNITELELKLTLFRALDALPRVLRVDRVLVENQPLKAREKIKGVGHALFDYYVLRGRLDQGRTFDVQFIDAKNKLTVYDGPAISCGLKSQYARNKWYSIEYCRWALRAEPGLCRFFEGFKKRDDLADCFLQGAWYLKFGQHGTRGEVTSTHQKLVYAANNALTYNKVRPRAPSKKSLASGRLTLANIKWLRARKGGVPAALQAAVQASLDFYGCGGVPPPQPPPLL